MEIAINQNENLTVACTQEEQNELDSSLSGFESNGSLYKIFERLLANSEYDWIEPEEIGALTDAPILGIREGEESESIASAWAFMDYQVTSPQEQLRKNGECIFINAEVEPKN